jgi:hypothetical protein
MKHLKPFNENNTEKLEAQDLLDFSQDLVDAGYGVKYYIFGSVITPDDIINARGDKLEYFDIYYKGILKIEISDFPMIDFQKVISYMESFKRHIDEYSFVLDRFDCETGIDTDKNPIIKKIEYIFKNPLN